MNFITSIFSFLLKFVVYCVSFLIDLLLTPFWAALGLLFPNLSNYFYYFLDFLEYGLFNHFHFICRALHITPAMTSAIWTFFMAKISIFLLISSLSFILKLWGAFKGHAPDTDTN